MGLFSKKTKTGDEGVVGSEGASHANAVASQNGNGSEPKKSLYRKWQDFKRGPGTAGISDEEFEQATGMTRVEHAKWANTTPGVAGGQAAGSITAGGTSGIGLTGASEGFGGWGWEAGKAPKER